MKTMKGIQSYFKLKNDEIIKPSSYLGATLYSIINANGKECWAMSADKYCESTVANVEATLEKKGLKLPSKCYTPLSSGYAPELDASPELKADGFQ